MANGLGRGMGREVVERWALGDGCWTFGGEAKWRYDTDPERQSL